MTSLYKVIVDPIHGNLNISTELFDIIDDPVFQRLRKIRQLSFTYYVYPGAIHTRFEHSLGVANQTGIYIDNLINNTRRFILESSACENNANDTQRIFLTELLEKLKEKRDIIIMAGLLHDIGHLMYSHVFEQITQELIQYVAFGLLNPARMEQDLFDEYQTFLSNIARTLTMKMALHEHLGTIIIRKLLRDKLGENASLISNLLEYTYSKDEFILKHISGDKPVEKAVYKIASKIISGAIDADRTDYMSRDSYYAGKSNGIFDINRLLSTIVIVSIPERKSRGIGDMSIGVVDKGVGSVELMLLNRVYLYKDVYLHNISLAYSGIAKRVLTLLTISSVVKNIGCKGLVGEFLDCIRSILSIHESIRKDNGYDDKTGHDLRRCLNILTDEYADVILGEILYGRDNGCVINRLKEIFYGENNDNRSLWIGTCSTLLLGIYALKYRRHWPFLYLEGKEANQVIERSFLYNVNKLIRSTVSQTPLNMSADISEKILEYKLSGPLIKTYPYTVIEAARYSAYDSRKEDSIIYVYNRRQPSSMCGYGETLSKDRSIPGITKLILDEIDGKVFSKFLILNPFLNSRSLKEKLDVFLNSDKTRVYKFKTGKLHVDELDKELINILEKNCGIRFKDIMNYGVKSATRIIDELAPKIL
ncbi:MAG: HD domain-containing protein [Desulfurococcales archaeon]|nr:HD domain-containing protein [Desulfurococcales archaeon]MEB3789330.1 HD domain-containing protein [Desulfurococcales archaeon]